MNKKGITKMLCKKVTKGQICSFLKTFFPILTWLPHYNLHKLKGDIIAGITVGIMIIPQSIAFANLAGIPPEYGLYAALTPALVYCIFGTSKDLSMGPTVTMALFTSRFNPTQHPIGATFLAFLVGLVLIVMGILRLGFVTKYIPNHVISAFVSATAITIAITQLTNLFGLPKAPSNLFMKVVHFVKHVKQTNKWDVSLGIACILYLAIFMWWNKRKPSSRPTKHVVLQAIVAKVKWLLCAARSALVCLLGTMVVYIFFQQGINHNFTIAGKLPQGLPSVQIPIKTVEIDNKTVTAGDFISGYGASLIVLPMIQFIQAISIAKAFARKFRYKIDSTQELIALGLANFVGSFFGGWPVCGSFSRSAVNSMSGAQTPVAGVFSSVIVFLAVEFLTPVFYYIPKTTLAAMILMAVVTMVDISIAKRIWRLNKVDMIPFLVAFFGSFYKLEVGVLAGTGVAILIMMSKEATPKHTSEKSLDKSVVTFTMRDSISYPGVDSLSQTITAFLAENESIEFVEIDVSCMLRVDYSALIGLEQMRNEINDTFVTVKFVNVPSDVHAQFLEAGLLKEQKQTAVTISNEGATTEGAGQTTVELKPADTLIENKNALNGPSERKSNDTSINIDNFAHTKL